MATEGEPGAAPLLDNASPEFFFWLRHARRSQEPIVVLGAASGRVAIPLAMQELRVVAVEADASQRMAGEGRSAELPIRWVAGDPVTFSLERRAGMVLLAGRTFERLLSLDEQQAALRRIYGALQVGGKLALVCRQPDVRAMAEPGDALRLLDPLTDPVSHQTVYRWASIRYDRLAQQCHEHLLFEQVDQDGVTVCRWHRSESYAFVWPREMRLLLAGAGFEIEASFGGWNDEPLTVDTALHIWVARKGA